MIISFLLTKIMLPLYCTGPNYLASIWMMDVILYSVHVRYVIMLVLLVLFEGLFAMMVLSGVVTLLVILILYQTHCRYYKQH